MTMELQLTTWERMALLNVLGELQGNLATLRRAGKAMDVLELSEEERALVRFQTISMPQGEVGYQWLDSDHSFAVEIADPGAAALLKQAAAQYQGWHVPDREGVEALMAKLEVE